jgi:hypothetical protein
VPKEIVIERPLGGGSGGIGLSGCGTSSLLRRWSWMRDKGGTLEGQASGIVRSSGCDEVEEHAAELLAIADDSFEEGCSPKKSAPAAIAWTKPGPGIETEAPATFDDPAEEPFHVALRAAKATTSTCKASL